MEKRVGLLILIISLLVIGGLYYIAISLMNEEKENNTKEVTTTLYDALSKVEVPEKYYALKKDYIIGPDKNTSRTIEVIRDGKRLQVILKNSEEFLHLEYMSDGNKSAICLNFSGKEECGEPQVIPGYAYSLRLEEFKNFLDFYGKQILALENGGALELNEIRRSEVSGKECTLYSYSYSFGDLPLREIRNAQISVSKDMLDVKFNSKICLNEGVMLFEKSYNLSGEERVEGVRTEKFIVDTNISPREVPENLSNIATRSLWNTYKLFLDDLKNATDPQLRSLAFSYRIPEICLKAENPDRCLTVYVDKFMDQRACELMENVTLMEECIALTSGNTSKSG